MKPTRESVLEAAMQLSPEDREMVYHELHQSLYEEDPGIMRAWVEEAKRRREAYERGETQPVPIEDALQRMREKYG